MEDLHLNPAKARSRAEGKAKLRGVHVPPHRPHRSDSPQFVQHILIAHISRVQDQLNPRQQFLEARVKEAVCIRDYTDLHRLGLMAASPSDVARASRPLSRERPAPVPAGATCARDSGRDARATKRSSATISCARTLHLSQCAWLTRQQARLVLQPHGQGSMLSRRSAWFRRCLLSEASSRPGSSVKFVGVNSPSSRGQAAASGRSGAGLTFGRPGLNAPTKAASAVSVVKR